MCDDQRRFTCVGKPEGVREFLSDCECAEIANGGVECDNGSVFGLSASGGREVYHIRSYLAIIGSTCAEYHCQSQIKGCYSNDRHNFRMNR